MYCNKYEHPLSNSAGQMDGISFFVQKNFSASFGSNRVKCKNNLFSVVLLLLLLLFSFGQVLYFVIYPSAIGIMNCSRIIIFN